MNEIDICLDEIEAAQDMLCSDNVSSDTIAHCKGWVLKQKARLKELGYKGKMPRKKRQVRELA
jgi:hypothetical protein